MTSRYSGDQPPVETSWVTTVTPLEEVELDAGVAEGSAEGIAAATVRLAVRSKETGSISPYWKTIWPTTEPCCTGAVTPPSGYCV